MAGAAGPCIEYVGARDDDGYGRVPRTEAEFGTRLAHRIALGRKLGRKPNGVSRHLCDNSPCVNPDHLIEGTQAQNIQDRTERGRGYRPPVLEQCGRGHDIAIVGRDSQRRCNGCRREDSRKLAADRKAARHARKEVA